MRSLPAMLLAALGALLVGCGAQAAPLRSAAVPRDPKHAPAATRSNPGLHPVIRTGAAASSRKPEPNAPTPCGDPIGVAGPVVVESVGASGRWAALCQAREDTDGDGKLGVHYGPRGEFVGDRMQSYFVLGSGPGEAIDALAAQDSSGRHVVIAQQGRLLLVDTQTAARTDLTALGADDRSDALAFVQHRSLAFDPDGRRLAYLRRDPGPYTQGRRVLVVVRDLSSGTEREIKAGLGEPWRVRFSPDGRELVLEVIARDTNGNGRLEWPVPRSKVNRWRCHGPIAPYPVWTDRGDRPATRVVSVDTGKARSVVGWISSLGDQDLVRDFEGRLLLVRGSARSMLMDKECGGVMLYADPSRRLSLVACSAETPRASVWLVGPGLRRDLEIDVQPTSMDYLPERLTRLFILYPGADAVLVDMERRSLARLTPGDDVVATSGALALVRRGTDLVVYDADSGQERKLGAPLDAFGPTLLAGSIVFVPPLVVRLPEVRTGKTASSEPSVLGKAPGAVLGLNLNGHLLIPSAPPTDDAPAQGPLHWVGPVR
ncbi:MAG: hypothetical protein JW940_39315 [Polyangiaceae bacterium]|nr:hypothetical protein [Polyangiaceae bacterium]